MSRHRRPIDYWQSLHVAGFMFLLGRDPMCRHCRVRRATARLLPYGEEGPLLLLVTPICTVCSHQAENPPTGGQ